MQINRISLGQFENISGRFAISDPCYDTNVWCRGELTQVRKGKWNAEVGIYDAGNWGRRVALLIATHEDYDEDAEGNYQLETAPFEVGVDSGQAGIFDAIHYKDDSIFWNRGNPVHDYGDNGEKWYGFCCDATLNTEHQADVIPFGVVSSSGFGDGGYDCIYFTDTNGEIIKTIITFIDEDYESENNN